MELKEATSLASIHSGLQCPKCGSLSIRKNGFCLGIQRLKCKKCFKCFKETINTPLHGIHDKTKMIKYFETMKDQQSIRDAAAKLQIALGTSFSWRHKILSSFASDSQQKSKSPVGMCTIIQPHSFKGKKNKPEKHFPDTRTILATDIYGVPCLTLLPAKCTAIGVLAILHSSFSPQAPFTVTGKGILNRAAKLIAQNEIEHPFYRKPHQPMDVTV